MVGVDEEKLRADRDFVVPAKRNEPLELRDSDQNPADTLVADYLGARDLRDKAKAVEAILRDLPLFDDAAAQLLPVVEDINDASRKSLRLNPTASVELILVRDELQGKVKELNFDEEQITVGEVLTSDRVDAPDLLRNLSLSRSRQVLAAFESAFGDNWVTELLNLVPSCNLRTIGEIASLLAEKGHSDTVLEFFENGLQQRALSSDALAWVCRERKGLSEVIFDPSLSLAVMSALEKDSLNDEGAVRAANRLRDLVSDDKTLIADLIAESDINTVRNFASRLMGSAVFDDLTRKSLMARIIKMYPEIQDLITHDKHEDEVILVSEKSLETRQAAYQKLISEEIPQNREDIKIARSYGDLRENFEYKSAKEYQRVLMKRKADWERDLKHAKAIDFSNADPSQVSIGTIVRLEPLSGGEPLTYTILGAWDSDPDRGVIAYLSDRGQILLGKKVGDEAALPTGEGSLTDAYRIADISSWKG